MFRAVQFELAVQDVAGARIAVEVGADRVEVCAALGETGGLTPSIGLIERLVALGGPPVHALVRPRPGGYVWTADELAVQVADVRALVAAGVSGVVVGALTPAGEVAADVVAALVAAAGGRDVTFHRAIDTVADPFGALDALVGLGVTRVLTSGGAARCIEGIDALAALARHAAGRIEIQAGGGVRTQDINALVAAGVDGVHLSARRPVPGAGGPGGGGDVGHDVTDAALARAAGEALAAALTARRESGFQGSSPARVHLPGDGRSELP